MGWGRGWSRIAGALGIGAAFCMALVYFAESDVYIRIADSDHALQYEWVLIGVVLFVVAATSLITRAATSGLLAMCPALAWAVIEPLATFDDPMSRHREFPANTIMGYGLGGDARSTAVVAAVLLLLCAAAAFVACARPRRGPWGAAIVLGVVLAAIFSLPIVRVTQSDRAYFSRFHPGIPPALLVLGAIVFLAIVTATVVALHSGDRLSRAFAFFGLATVMSLNPVLVWGIKRAEFVGGTREPDFQFPLDVYEPARVSAIAATVTLLVAAAAQLVAWRREREPTRALVSTSDAGR